MPLLYSMLGELLTVMLTFVKSGKIYFSESLVPAANSYTKRRMAFSDLHWGLTLMFSLVVVPLAKVTTSER